MPITQKCHYALRAVFELSMNAGNGPLKIGDIARQQQIPSRFLEVILNELKQGGFVYSKRGKEGGYMLSKEPSQVSVGDIIRFVEGSISPVDEQHMKSSESGSSEVFVPIWTSAEEMLKTLYDETSFAKLVEDEIKRRGEYVPNYSI